MIKKIDSSQLKIVQEIAQKTWPTAFGEILSREQLEYMMKMMYSLDVLENQLKTGHEFYLYFDNEIPLGFMGIELNYNGLNQLKIHKLYILPNQQGKGIGEKFIRFAFEKCSDLTIETLTLNVNRFNKAVTFYEKLGFKNVKSEDIEIGNGYLMEDFVMEKEIK
jgi:GNAT superfamily N-acetyltransferase